MSPDLIDQLGFSHATAWSDATLAALYARNVDDVHINNVFCIESALRMQRECVIRRVLLQTRTGAVLCAHLRIAPVKFAHTDSLYGFNVSVDLLTNDDDTSGSNMSSHFTNVPPDGSTTNIVRPVAKHAATPVATPQNECTCAPDARL
jgi:hypothetical protein